MSTPPAVADATSILKGGRTEIRDPVVDSASIKSVVPPPNYCVIRQGTNTGPERFPADTDQEAFDTLKRQVCQGNGQVSIVYIYKLIGAEQFEATSRTLTPDDLKERASK